VEPFSSPPLSANCCRPRLVRLTPTLSGVRLQDQQGSLTCSTVALMLCMRCTVALSMGYSIGSEWRAVKVARAARSVATCTVYRTEGWTQGAGLYQRCLSREQGQTSVHIFLLTARCIPPFSLKGVTQRLQVTLFFSNTVLCLSTTVNSSPGVLLWPTRGIVGCAKGIAGRASPGSALGSSAPDDLLPSQLVSHGGPGSADGSSQPSQRGSGGGDESVPILNCASLVPARVLRARALPSEASRATAGDTLPLRAANEETLQASRWVAARPRHAPRRARAQSRASSRATSEETLSLRLRE